MIEDLGGATKVAKICGITRTAPYGWIKADFVSSRMLDKIKDHDPSFSIDKYLGSKTGK